MRQRVETGDLIEAGESLTVEFTSHVNDCGLTRAAACLANGEGGVLLVGVEDDRTIVGAKPRHGKGTEVHRVAALVQNSTEPPLSVAAVIEVIDGKEVLRIDVPPADPGPVGTKDGVFTKRVLDSTGGPQCLPMTILISGTEAAVGCWIPSVEFLFHDLRSGTDASNVRIVGPMLQAAERLSRLVDERNTVTDLQVGVQRVEVPLIPSVTRREAIANSLVHRPEASQPGL